MGTVQDSMGSPLWTNMEKLLLAQAVYKFGEGNWPTIAKTLRNHPSVNRPPEFFTQKSCAMEYSMLMEAQALRDSNAGDETLLLAVARHLWTIRVAEIKEEITRDEERFKKIVMEIEEIRSGRWDAKLEKEIAAAAKEMNVEAPENASSNDMAVDTLAGDLEKGASEPEPSLNTTTPSQDSISPTISKGLSSVEKHTLINTPTSTASTPNPPEEPSAILREEGKATPDQIVDTAMNVRPPSPMSVDAQTPAEEVQNFGTHQKPPSSSTPIHGLDTNSPITTLPSEAASQVSPFSAIEPRSSEDQGQPPRKRAKSHSVSMSPSSPTQIASEEQDKRIKDDVSPMGSPHTASATGDHQLALSDDGSNGDVSGQERKRDEQRWKSWQKNVNLLWREISNHKNGTMFMNPIKEQDAPRYHEVVRFPMDLKTVKQRIRDGVTRSTLEVERDILLMLCNSLMYNRSNTEVYQMASEMFEDVEEQIGMFKTADSTNSSTKTHSRRKSIVEKTID